nr:MAG TPA: holin [Caudoviricetes sp.]
MINWKRKLTSRKLWIAVAGLVSGCIIAFGGGEDTAKVVSGIIMQAASVVGYLLAEGLTDIAHANGSGDEADGG